MSEEFRKILEEVLKKANEAISQSTTNEELQIATAISQAIQQAIHNSLKAQAEKEKK